MLFWGYLEMLDGGDHCVKRNEATLVRLLLLENEYTVRLEGGTAPRRELRSIAKATGGRCPPLNER